MQPQELVLIERLLSSEEPAGMRHAVSSIARWPELLELAGAHGVEGVLAHRLARASALLPEPARDAMYRRIAQRRLLSQYHADALDHVLRSLESAGIVAVSLKGRVFGERFYPEPSMRPTTDIDLLIDPRELDAAARALAGLGYHPFRALTPRHRRLFHQLELVHPELPMVELHFHAHVGFGTVIEARELVLRSHPYTTERGATTHVLCPEDELIYLSVHAASHLFRRLSWLYDLKLLLASTPAPDEEIVLSRCRSLSVVRSVHSALLEAERRVGSPVPLCFRKLDEQPLVRFLRGRLIDAATGLDQGTLARSSSVVARALACDRIELSAVCLLQNLERALFDPDWRKAALSAVLG